MATVQRQVLPIPDRAVNAPATYDAKDPDTAFPPIEPLRPPAGAPNVLIVLIDDCGFGATSAFGGPVPRPRSSAWPPTGLKYTRFHTTALCSPTRPALLTGRNHHTVGMGGITEIATSAPGLQLDPPQHRAPLAETLKLNGYSTAQFGKCHEVPVWQTSPMGPFDSWPTRRRRLRALLRLHRRRDQPVRPGALQGTMPVEPDRTPEEGYHLTEDMTDHAIDWIRQQKALMPDKPFFVYFAPGRDPRAAPRARSSGRTSTRASSTQAGTRCGRRRFARQKELGVVPTDAELTARHERDPGLGRRCPTTLKPVLARQMEVYAGFLEHTDHHVGRLHRRPRGAGHPGRHARLRHHRRQRRVRRRRPSTARFNELLDAQRRRRPGDARVHGRPDRRVRHADGLQPLRGGLGPRDGHAVPVDQAGGLALGRHPQRHHRALAQRHRRQGRDPQPVPPRHRRRADGPRGRRAAGADLRPRRPAGALRGRQHALHLRRRRRPPSGTRRSTSRCSSTGASTTRAGPR